MFWALVSSGIVAGEVIWDLFLKEKAKQKLPVYLFDLIDIAFMLSSFAFPTATSIQHFRTLPTAVKLAEKSKKVKEALKQTGVGVVLLGMTGYEGTKLYKKGKEVKEHIGKYAELERERQELEKEKEELLKELQDLYKEKTFKIKNLERQLYYYDEIQRQLKGYLEKKGVIFLPVPSETESELKYNLEKEKKKGKGGK
jgi:Skp family chaperone for outer membrane proteins